MFCDTLMLHPVWQNVTKHHYWNAVCGGGVVDWSGCQNLAVKDGWIDATGGYADDLDYTVTLANGEERTVRIGRSTTSHAEVVDGLDEKAVVRLE